MMYFKYIYSLEDLRKEYKRLVKANHPDNGGSEDAIKVINVEYEITFKVLAKADTSNAIKYDMAADEQIRDIINIIINFDINIEICGSWIWVSGNTYTCKDDLKSNGFHWASKKKMWYWHDPEEQTRSNGKTTMDDIRNKYGSETIKKAETKMCISAQFIKGNQSPFMIYLLSRREKTI